MITIWQVALVLTIAALIITIFALRDIVHAKRIIDLQRGVNEELTRRTELYKAAAARSDMAAELFSVILLDLAHTDGRESICWKLSTIRHVEIVMRTSGWKDSTMYQWMVDNLYKGDYDNKVTWIDRLEEIVKSYYIMDKEIGNNVCDVLRLIARMSTGYDAAEESYYDAEGRMMTLVDALNLSFTMYDTQATPQKEGYRASFEDLLKALEQSSGVTSGTITAVQPAPIHLDKDGGDESVREDCEEKEPPTEGDQDRDAAPVQGDETPVEGDTQGEVIEDGAEDVIVVNKPRSAKDGRNIRIETEE